MTNSDEGSRRSVAHFVERSAPRHGLTSCQKQPQSGSGRHCHQPDDSSTSFPSSMTKCHVTDSMTSDEGSEDKFRSAQ